MTWLLESLPAPLRASLVHGSEGAGHLAACARLASDHGLHRLANDLILAAWAESPLDASLASLASSMPDATPAVRELAAFVAGNTTTPTDLAYYRRLADRRESSKIGRYLETQSAREPGNLYWTRLALTHAADQEDWDRALAAIAGLPEPLERWLAGDMALYAGDNAKALATFSRAARLWNCPGIEDRLGLTHLACGDQSGAERWLRASLAREPWRVRTLNTLSDLTLGRRGLSAMPEGRTRVLLYTFNKAVDLDRTLSSLLPSELGGAGVTVLDNGSADATPDVLAAWREKAGEGRMDAVRLPVNVGAPAARNWLMSLPSVRESDWTVFLDDDVELPGDWLGLLGASAGLYPEAGVWGAKVVDHSRPAHVQSADVFLTPGAGDGGPAFSLSSCHHEVLDRGQFACARPCATVTGCCHLFRTGRLLAAGGFDIRFSPSQYDDLDHDLRLLLSGRHAVCQGHLAVRHFKSTGSQGSAGQAQYGLGWANQYKLDQKYAPDQVRRMAEVADAAAWEDALARHRAVAQGLGT